MMPSRKEITEQANMMYCLHEQDAARPLWEKLRPPGQAVALVGQWKASALSTARHGLLSVLGPSLERASMSFGIARAQHEAAMVVLERINGPDRARAERAEISARRGRKAVGPLRPGGTACVAPPQPSPCCSPRSAK